MTWQEIYKKELFERCKNWSRVRGKSKKTVHAILRKKHDSKSNIFSRCRFCHTGLKIKGVCVTCGYAYVCSKCKKIIQPDGSAIDGVTNENKISHGLCLMCGMVLRRELNDLLLQEKYEKGK